ncbi:MAG: RdgB/HAM1 family non-canonical purine NTP pyrophosphatase [Acidobacteria bacterium]|nr:RdgB/HAM1 family non-canonical purine NTP pyrophosphatase [Acidobacteriota bacterium]
MTVLLATTNPGKLREMLPLLDGVPMAWKTLADLAPIAVPDETGSTFRENARIKALAYAAASGLPVVAEDSGLVIDALGGAPGIHSAQFLGDAATYPERFAEIERRLARVPGATRDARFVTALAVAVGSCIVFETEASVAGTIVAPRGTGGFGYDPIFLYRPMARTTAELSLEEKATVSHRGRAFRDFRRACLAGAIQFGVASGRGSAW